MAARLTSLEDGLGLDTGIRFESGNHFSWEVAFKQSFNATQEVILINANQ